MFEVAVYTENGIAEGSPPEWKASKLLHLEFQIDSNQEETGRCPSTGLCREPA